MNGINRQTTRYTATHSHAFCFPSDCVSCPLTPVVSKASSGAMEIAEIYGYDNLEDMVQVTLFLLRIYLPKVMEYLNHSTF